MANSRDRTGTKDESLTEGKADSNQKEVKTNFGAIASTEELHGKYCNIAFIQHTENEFVIDFLFGAQEQNMLVSRVIMSPDHAKRLHNALGHNIEDYERKHGRIIKKGNKN